MKIDIQLGEWNCTFGPCKQNKLKLRKLPRNHNFAFNKNDDHVTQKNIWKILSDMINSWNIIAWRMEFEICNSPKKHTFLCIWLVQKGSHIVIQIDSLSCFCIENFRNDKQIVRYHQRVWELYVERLNNIMETEIDTETETEMYHILFYLLMNVYLCKI
jgi:hypothetical protein